MVWLETDLISAYTSYLGEGCSGGLSRKPYHPLYNLVSLGKRLSRNLLEHNVFTTSREEALYISRELEKSSIKPMGYID